MRGLLRATNGGTSVGWLGDLLGGLPPVSVFVLVAALVAAEAAFVPGVVLPSATALIATGLLANAGVVPIVPAVLVAIGAALLGGNYAYWAAASSAGAPRVTGSRLGRHLERAERLFARYGGRAIFLGQWIVGARTLMPRLAGRNGVPRKRFALWHTPAATLWAVWMVGGSYLAGAGYDVLAARAGRAAGALAALTLIIVGLLLAGRWLGQNPSPVRTLSRSVRHLVPHRLLHRGWPPMMSAAVSLGLLTALALVLIAVIPPVVRFSGLADADRAIADWTRSQWTSDGYLFALDSATTLAPEVLIALTVPVALVRWWWPRRSAALTGFLRNGLFEAVGPVLPAVVLAGALSLVSTPGWRAADQVVLPGPADFDGTITLDLARGALASMSAGATAQVAAAAGLLAWLLSHGLPWRWRVTVWTGAGILVTVCAGSWIYLGWSRTSETVAAIALGAAWAALNAALWSARARAKNRPDEPARDLDAIAA